MVRGADVRCVTNHWPEISGDAALAIEEALERGSKIEAIKIYRRASGVCLKDAKDAVDRADEFKPTQAEIAMVNRQEGSSPVFVVVGLMAIGLSVEGFLCKVFP
jgi:hypothetical protein